MWVVFVFILVLKIEPGVLHLLEKRKNAQNSSVKSHTIQDSYSQADRSWHFSKDDAQMVAENLQACVAAAAAAMEKCKLKPGDVTSIRTQEATSYHKMPERMYGELSHRHQLDSFHE